MSAFISKIDEVLHPEVMMGKRGDEIEYVHYQRVFRRFARTSGGFRVFSPIVVDPSKSKIKTKTLKISPEQEKRFEDFISYTGLSDNFCKLGWAVQKQFMESGSRCFYIPASFGRALGKMDKELPIEVFGDRTFCAYFHFGKGALHDEEGPVQEAYLFVGPAKMICVAPGDTEELVIDVSKSIFDQMDRFEKNNVEALNTRIVAIVYNCRDSKGVLSGFSTAWFPLERKSLEQALAPAVIKDYGFLGKELSVSDASLKKRKVVQRAILNAGIYVHSNDPDIQRLRPQNELSKKQKKEEKKKCPVDNLCTVPVSVLSWSYYGRAYSKESSFVDSFLRWQRCGHKLSEVKLVWVKAHERRYKKTVKEGDSSGYAGGKSDVGGGESLRI